MIGSKSIPITLAAFCGQVYGNALWAAPGTWGNYGDYMEFTQSGDLQVMSAIVNYSAYVIWDTGTIAGNTWDNGAQGWWLAVQDDGNLVIYDANYNAVWAACEGQRCSDFGVGC
jgi:hypothetical protein